ncbi:MAG: toll/interleukin-1 receptor domain-containing protein [Desulfobacterales bacterium]|nr:toll/interleukin-1 receptor domain-containing protein [Desulfobacterales bacterium]
MAFFERSELQLVQTDPTESTFKSWLNKEVAKITANKLLSESAFAFTADQTYDIFLSHSKLDSSEIYKLKTIIEGIGLSVYVDWVDDPELDRLNVTRDNARRIRERMNACRSLVFAVTENSLESKWAQWELGYCDGKINRVAILPIKESHDNSDEFSGNEYLGLYPYIVKEYSRKTGSMALWVSESSKKYVIIDNWLNGEEPYEHG